MTRFSGIFSQLLQLFPRTECEQAVKVHQAERSAKGFTSWGQFVAMLFCQLGRAHSLREICGGLASCEGKLKHLGVPEAPKKSTLAYANANRPWELYQTVCEQLYGKCQSVVAKLGGKKKFRFKNKLASLDASTIDLCVVWGALIVVGFAVSNGRVLLFRVTPGTLKAMRRHMQDNARLRLTQTGWNAYSRIDAVEGFPPPNLARLSIDSDAWTNAQQWDGNIESIRNVRDWYRALPFRLVSSPETLMIGPGGGSDVLVALASGSRKVTAVELNPLMLRFVRHYGERAGNIYNRSDVEVIESEGRSFISWMCPQRVE